MKEMKKYTTENADTYFDREEWRRQQELLDYVRRCGKTLDGTCLEQGGAFSTVRQAYGELIPVLANEKWRIRDQVKKSEKLKKESTAGGGQKKMFKKKSPFEIPIDQLVTRHVYTKGNNS